MQNSNKKEISKCCGAESIIDSLGNFSCNMCLKPFIAEEKKESAHHLGVTCSEPTPPTKTEEKKRCKHFYLETDTEVCLKCKHENSLNSSDSPVSNAHIEDWEEDFIAKFIFPAEQSYKSAVSDQVAPYRHALENLLEVKEFIKQTLSSHRTKVIQECADLQNKLNSTHDGYFLPYIEQEIAKGREKVIEEMVEVGENIIGDIPTIKVYQSKIKSLLEKK